MNSRAESCVLLKNYWNMNFPYVLAEYLLSKAVFNLVQNSISLYESVNGLAVWSKSASNRGHPHKFQFIKKWAHTQYETGFFIW